MAVGLRVAKWVLAGEEFKDFKLNDVRFKWEACMLC